MARRPPTKATSGRAPDGGWGWVIITACFVNYFFLGLVFTAFALIYIALVEHFQAGRGVTGGIGSLFAFTGNILGVLIGALVKKFGCRRICMIGCILLCASHLLNSLLVSIPYMYFTHGIIGGIGNGFVYLPTTVILHQYFDKKLPVAVGLGMSGLSIGSTVSSPLVNFLLKHYGLSGCYVMMAGLWLHTVIATSLFRPVYLEQMATRLASIGKSKTDVRYETNPDGRKNPDPDNNADPRKGEVGHPAAEIPDRVMGASPAEDGRDELADVDGERFEIIRPDERLGEDGRRVDAVRSGHRKAPSASGSWTRYLDFELLKRRDFVSFLLATFAVSCAISSFMVHFTSRSIHVGVERHLAVIIQVTMDGCTVLGRCLFSALANIKNVDHHLLYGGALMFTSVVVLTLPLGRTFNVLLFFGVLNGMLVGGNFCVQLISLFELVGSDQSEMSVGYFSMVLALGSLTGVPVTGLIYDVSHSYDVPFYVIGAFDAIGAGFMFLTAFFFKKNRSVDVNGTQAN